MSETSIPVLTQPCADVHLRPLGAVIAESDWHDKFDKRFYTLIDNIREAALPGTRRIYNLQWVHRDFHGHQYLRGTADCFALEFEDVGGREPRFVSTARACHEGSE